MKKQNILAIVLEVLIFVILILLALTPVFRNKDKQEENTMEKEETKDLSNIVFIELGLNPLINGEGATVVDNSIQIERGGTYNLSGSLINGSIYINTSEPVQLNLNNVNINSLEEALVIEKAQEVIINLPKGSTNYIQDGANNEYEGAITSKSLITFTGEGKLVINALKMSIASSLGYKVNGGELIFFGNNDVIKPLDDSRQNTLIFNLDNTLEPSKIYLEKENEEQIISEEMLKNTHNIIISSPKIQLNDSYYLLINKDNEKQRVKINITDLYLVNAKNTWYGNS